jgi:hypothetical protein
MIAAYLYLFQAVIFHPLRRSKKCGRSSKRPPKISFLLSRVHLSSRGSSQDKIVAISESPSMKKSHRGPSNQLVDCTLVNIKLIRLADSVAGPPYNNLPAGATNICCVVRCQLLWQLILRFISSWHLHDAGCNSIFQLTIWSAV